MASSVEVSTISPLAQGAFEIFQAVPPFGDIFASGRPPRGEDRPAMRPVLEIHAGDTVWAGIDSADGQLRRTSSDDHPVAAFVFVKSKFSHRLAMFGQRAGLLVDGLPTLAMTLLMPKSSLVLAAGCHCLVTERVVPYIGPPTEAMLAAKHKCAFCKLPLAADSRVITHRCDAVYHFETPESHPELKDDDRLACAQAVRHCLCCRRPISFQPYRVWDPSRPD